MAGIDMRSGGWVQPAMYASLAIAVVGAIFTLMNRGGGGAYSGSDERFFICAKCGHKVTWTIDEYIQKNDQANQELLQQLQQSDPRKAERLRKLIEEPDAMMEDEMALPSWGTRRFPFVCPSCGESALITAMKCKKCGEVFDMFSSGKYSDKCPKCSYSASEERRKKKKK